MIRFKIWASNYKLRRRQKRQVRSWIMSGCAMPAPQMVKENVLSRHCIAGATWVETGTYTGTTTKFLSNLGKHTYTIEPQINFHNAAKIKFKGRNVTPIFGTSEDALPSLLSQLDGEINFWLDGHYSGGETFFGHNECPILQELSIIKSHLNNFNKICIFIDDVRCFLDGKEYPQYPRITELIAWSSDNNFVWRIEHDILILKQDAPKNVNSRNTPPSSKSDN